MSAATATRLGATFAREAEAAAQGDPFAPGEPMVWWCGRLRYSDEPQAPAQLRLREKLRRLWYDRLKSPPEGTEERRVFPDIRRFYATRGEAHARCPEGDPTAFVVGFPFGGEPFGDEVFDIPTFCRPYFDGPCGREKDARDAGLYAQTDLRAHICADLYAENERQRAELEKFWSLVPQAYRLTRTCDDDT